MNPCAKSNAHNSKLLCRGRRIFFFFCCIAIYQKAQRSGRATCHVCWFCFLLLGGGGRNLLEALQTRQPFNKMHLLFPMFALVKGSALCMASGVAGCWWTLTSYQLDLHLNRFSSEGRAKRTNTIKYRPILCLCFLRVQPEFMLLVLQAFQSHTDQRGFVRYATISQLMPRSTAVRSALSAFLPRS